MKRFIPFILLAVLCGCSPKTGTKVTASPVETIVAEPVTPPSERPRPAEDFDPQLAKDGVAVVYFYRPGGEGASVAYDISMGNEVVARLRNNSTASVRITKLGKQTFWSETESRAEVAVDIKPGHHYYIKCGIIKGMFVARPTLNLVDNKTGKIEYAKVNQSK